LGMVREIPSGSAGTPEEPVDVFRKLESSFMGAEGPFPDRAIEFAYDPKGMGGMDDADAIGSTTDDCGDRLEIFLKLERDTIVRASFLCDGCGVSLACGSALAQLLGGKTAAEAAAISAGAVSDFLGGLPDASLHAAEDWIAALEDALAAVHGVSGRPNMNIIDPSVRTSA
jgi:nitrogen fixation protein NifU and related proteins